MRIVVVFADDNGNLGGSSQHIMHSDTGVVEVDIPAIKFGNTCAGRIGRIGIDAASIAAVLMPADGIRTWIGVLQEIAQIIIVVLKIDGTDKLPVERCIL